MPAMILAGISLFFLFERGSIVDTLSDSIITKNGIIAFYSLFLIVVLVPLLTYSIIKINFRFIVIPITLFGSLLFIKHNLLNVDFSLHPDTTWVFKHLELLGYFVFGILDIINTEIYRRSHIYEITSEYIRTSAGVISSKERIMMLNKVNDISIGQSVFGKVFNYGSIIPVTASGVGMGFNFAAVTGGSSFRWLKLPALSINVTGGHAIQVPKSRTHEALIGIKNHKEILESLLVYIERTN